MSAETTFSVEIITLIPPIWSALFSADNGLVGRAFADGKVRGTINHLRDFGKGKHGQVDDSPYGGGAGMVLTLEPLHRAIEVARSRTAGPVILLGPRGKPFNQKISKELSQGPGMTLVCGRYEGFDERVRKYIDFELSAGDFVLSAGDPAALTIVDSVVRLLPGVLGNSDSLDEESFASGMLEYPHYTRPANYDGEDVPEILLSGDHAKIAKWRYEQSILLTKQNRPDLLI